jgi:hypothetical protein
METLVQFTPRREEKTVRDPDTADLRTEDGHVTFSAS